MLQECYGIKLSSMLQWGSRMVCALCVGQLRGATIFRKQVLAADQQFLTYCNTKLCKAIVPTMDTDTTKSVTQLQGGALKKTKSLQKVKNNQPLLSVNLQQDSEFDTSTAGLSEKSQVSDSIRKEARAEPVEEFKVPNTTGVQKDLVTETLTPVRLRDTQSSEWIKYQRVQIGANIEREYELFDEFPTTKTCTPDRQTSPLCNTNEDLKSETAEVISRKDQPASSDSESAHNGCDVKSEILSNDTPKSQIECVTKLKGKGTRKKGKGRTKKPKLALKVKKRSPQPDTDDDSESTTCIGDDESNILIPTTLNKIRVPERTDLENGVRPKSFIFTRLQNEKQVSERKRVILTCDIVLKDTNACPFRHHKSWFQCFFCQKDFMEINPLRTHTVTTHSDIDDELKKIKRYPRSLQIEISNLECRHCTLKLTDVSSMRRHFVDVHKKVIYKECIADYKVNRSPYSCHLCERQFHVFRSLTTHLNEHYANCICDVCGKSFLNSKRLKVHKKTHENGQFPCNECGKILKTKTSKVNHVESVHCKRIIKCQICFEPMKHYNDRIKHMSEVHNITHTFKCHICSREYNIKHYLATHIRQTHGHRNKYCLECGMAFITNHGLKKHMLKHTGVKPYTCNVCCKSYARSYTLKEHMRAHDNEIFLAPE